MILDIAIIIFLILETANVLILYFKPGFEKGNGVAIFKEWNKSKDDEKQYLFTKYLYTWVANSKLVFIMLLIVVLAFGSEMLKLHAIIALIISIGAYFVTLRPIIKRIDEIDGLEVKGYSKTLNTMIIGFEFLFGLAIVLYYIQN